jgi:hypothetical protein
VTKVKLTTSFPAWPLLRQTPGWRGEWDGYKFYVNDDAIVDCDYWVVYDGLLKPETAICPNDNIIFIASEPPDIKHYSSNFLNQFSLVISCDNTIHHPNNLIEQQSLPWMVGIRQLHGKYETLLDFDTLDSSTNNIVKQKLLSVICSTKTITKGQRQRLSFIENLAEEHGNKIDIFGRGFNEVPDKWDSIAPYKYHLVMENSDINDYFTEKLTDAFLGRAYPIYWGCPNLEKYFPKESFFRIQLGDWPKISEIIDSELYEKSIGHIDVARNMVLHRYNLFSMLTNTFKQKKKSSTKRTQTIFPEKISKLSRISYLTKKIITNDIN